MLRTVSCLTFFVKTDTCFQEKSKEQHLFEIETYFCNNVKVFVTPDQFKASLQCCL